MSDVTMITYPIIAFLLARLNLRVPMWLSACAYVGVVGVFSYWFLGISIVELRPVAFIAYGFYLVLSFVVFYFFSKRVSPVTAFSASIIFVYTVLRYWEVPAYFDSLSVVNFERIFVLLLWAVYGLTLLWLLLKPKIGKVKLLVAGVLVLGVLHVAFYFSGLNVATGFVGNETYFMVARITGAFFMGITFIRSEKTK